jgi:hypothetical protein
MATWPGRCVVVTGPESCVLVVVAAEATGAEAMAAAAIPIPNIMARLRGVTIIVHSLISVLAIRMVFRFVVQNSI